MILVDTSVWIKHLRESDKNLIRLLEQGLVACHPFIIGELACESIKNRYEIISLLNDLPSTDMLDHHDIMEFIEYRNIMNKGIGYVDAHLLGSALISETPLWTFDNALKKIANQLSIAYDIKLNI
ncbi:MAG: PIN domain-containing protein [Thermodesulfobacteriota bacterium]|nr:PIN domain-containing protein [Thermodesulfobacteriota bacterium]